MLKLPFALSEALERSLREAYATPPRAYHHFGHVLEVLEHFHELPDWDDPVSVALAILFHDAIYVAGRSDNEAASAELAASCLNAQPLGAPYDPERVRQLILLTARHGALNPRELDRDAARFLDCDMAILAAPPARFAEYERAIATEYGHLPAASYRAGRTHFINKLLAAPRIYLSDFFFERYEALARENLRRALATL